MIVHKNPFFEIKLNNNYYSYNPKNREVIILPIVDKNKILLIKAKRTLLNKSLYELPAGSINKHESLVEGAKRELVEETGVQIFKQNKFIKMNSIYQIPNRNPKPVHAFYVKLKLNQISFKGYDKNEVSSIEVLHIKKVFELIKNNKIITSVPIAIILLFALQKHLLSIGID